MRVAILTVSDGVASGTREDTAGAAAEAWVDRHGWERTERRVVADEAVAIAGTLARWADAGRADLILTLGGTGLGPRDVTPEATRAVLERPAAGVAEALRTVGRDHTPQAMLGRGVAGARNGVLIVNLPGSVKAVREGLAVLENVVEHAIDLLAGRTEHAGGR